MTADERLETVLAAQVERVDRRVGRGATPEYAGETAEVRAAAAHVHDLRRRLGLARFVGAVTPQSAKPQFLLRFAADRSAADRFSPDGVHPGRDGEVVLKVYGRSRPAEARAQRLWRDHGVLTVDVLDHGDAPVSWLLMRALPADSSADAVLAGRTVTGTSAELAVPLTTAHRAGAGDAWTGYQSLEQALTKHLGATVAALRRHGYAIAQDWQGLLARACRGRPATVLHGDLVPGNVLRVGEQGPLVVLDTCGYAGPPEFDAARWAARTGGAGRSRDVLDAWLGVEEVLDPDLAHTMLGLELLMEAGVRELVKDENGEVVESGDPRTIALLDAAAG